MFGSGRHGRQWKTRHFDRDRNRTGLGQMEGQRWHRQMVFETEGQRQECWLPPPLCWFLLISSMPLTPSCCFLLHGRMVTCAYLARLCIHVPPHPPHCLWFLPTLCICLCVRFLLAEGWFRAMAWRWQDRHSCFLWREQQRAQHACQQSVAMVVAWHGVRLAAYSQPSSLKSELHLYMPCMPTA